MTEFTTLDPRMKAVPGQELGLSRWVEITQDMVSQFGAVTFDLDPMHTNPAWAQANGPYGGTIAFGFLTISLLTHLLHDAMGEVSAEDVSERDHHYLNYGFDRIRLISPVKTGSRVRGRFWLVNRNTDEKGRTLSRTRCEIEIEGSDRPALVAEWLSMRVPS